MRATLCDLLAKLICPLPLMWKFLACLTFRCHTRSVWLIPVHGAFLGWMSLALEAPAQLINVSISAGDNGDVSPEGTLQLAAHSDLTVTASPHTGYIVHDWYIDGAPGGWSVNVIEMHFGDLDVSIYVTFDRITNIVHAAASGPGQVSPAGDTIAVAWGEGVQFTATPDAHCNVSRWLLDNQPVQTGGNTFTLHGVESEHWVVVEFATDVYTVQARADAHGSLSPTGTVAVPFGENISFSASPHPGYDVVLWQLDGRPVLTNSTQFTLFSVDTNHTLQVSFVAPLLSIAQTRTNTLLLSWPTPLNDYELLESDALSATGWTQTPVAPVERGARQEVAVARPNQPKFYRLHRL